MKGLPWGIYYNAHKDRKDLDPVAIEQVIESLMTDEELYKKYKLTQEEIDYIEDTIAPMPTSDD